MASAVIAQISPQADGRRWVREVHTDDFQVSRERNYLADAGDDLNANLTAYAALLVADLGRAEVVQAVGDIMREGSLASVSVRYATLAQIRAGLRRAYATATRTEAIMLGDFLSTLTDNQLANLFGITAQQVTALRTNKLSPAAVAASSIRSATGT